MILSCRSARGRRREQRVKIAAPPDIAKSAGDDYNPRFTQGWRLFRGGGLRPSPPAETAAGK
ncbi:MAG TPA: hypothetical protein PL033_04940 [Candidatus Brocadiia bacterium]|nr:hypothetical protein [Candidatus Brocadiia bacterium]